MFKEPSQVLSKLAKDTNGRTQVFGNYYASYEWYDHRDIGNDSVSLEVRVDVSPADRKIELRVMAVCRVRKDQLSRGAFADVENVSRSSRLYIPDEDFYEVLKARLLRLDKEHPIMGNELVRDFVNAVAKSFEEMEAGNE